MSCSYVYGLDCNSISLCLSRMHNKRIVKFCCARPQAARGGESVVCVTIISANPMCADIHRPVLLAAVP